ncbi:hypothetical protein BGZ89_012687 [Linnemannia elongata]|nr:hypothetical protein BGZ89_012687 [Linnemannia elongata]
MSAARSHGGSDNGHSASIQIDPPAQPIAPSATGMPFPLPAHRPIYNDDDEDSDEDDPLLGASGTTRGGRGPRHHQLVDQDDGETGQRRQSGEPAPFLYRLHDWLADHGTKLKSFWSNPRSAKVSFPRWQTVLKWAFILLNVVLVLGLMGLSGWLWYEFVDVCEVKYSESVQLQYSFRPEQYKSFFFHLDQSTVGDITVSQYESYYEKDGGDEVRIYVNAKGSSSDIVRAVTLGSITNPDDSSIEANVYLSMREWERDRAFKRGCVKIDVSIVFPQNMTHFDSLKIHNRNKGDIDLHLGPRVDGLYSQNPDSRNYPGLPAPEGLKVAVDRLDIKTNNGNVFFSNAIVKEDLKVIAAQGSINGHITVDKRVETESKRSTILTIISDSTDLDVKASAETSANVIMKSGFSGHVALKTSSNMYNPRVSSRSNKFVRQTSTLQTLTGYFPYPNGTEPTTYLPRIELDGEQANLEIRP